MTIICRARVLGLALAAAVCLTAVLGVSSARVDAAEQVRIAGLTWPGYGFWYIADEKGLAPDLEISYEAIEDPYQSFGLASAGQLDVVSSTIEFAPIATAEGMPVRLVAYGNISYGTDKIVVGPGIESAKDLVGKKVAVLEGGLAQLYMAIWLEQNGVAYDQVEYVNLIMDDAAAAMIGGDVAAAEFWDPFGVQVLESRPDTRLAAQSREPFWLQNALIADALFMTADFVAERRDVALKTMRALYDAIAWWSENPAEGNDIIARRMQMSLADVELVIGKDGTGKDGGLYMYSFMGGRAVLRLGSGRSALRADQWPNRRSLAHDQRLVDQVRSDVGGDRAGGGNRLLAAGRSPRSRLRPVAAPWGCDAGDWRHAYATGREALGVACLQVLRHLLRRRHRRGGRRLLRCRGERALRPLGPFGLREVDGVTHGGGPGGAYRRLLDARRP